jgi:hypothetical protein
MVCVLIKNAVNKWGGGESMPLKMHVSTSKIIGERTVQTKLKSLGKVGVISHANMCEIENLERMLSIYVKHRNIVNGYSSAVSFLQVKSGSIITQNRWLTSQCFSSLNHEIIELCL